jgi:hypothetical protein
VSGSQRWRDRRERWVAAGPVIEPSAYRVDLIEERLARAFVCAHHYSGSFPAARLSAGLFRGRELVGAAVFSVPMNNRAIPRWAGIDAHAGAELGRLVLLDDVPGNGESWFVARALGLLAAEKRCEAVISYSDPVERLNAMGEVVKPGHIGVVYQALSAAYRGRSGERTGYLAPSGQPISGRALSKLRLGERGCAAVLAQLEAMGAPARGWREEGRAYVDRLAGEGWLTRYRHPGNHAYVFPLSRRAKAKARGLERLDYPRERAA